MGFRSLKRILLGLFLALVLLGHGFGSEDGYDPWEVPPGQPTQMWSQVDYDPKKLWDTWFDSDAWGYPYDRQAAASGKTSEGEDPSLLGDTAMCFSTGWGVKHVVDFCEARLVDVNTIDLFIHNDGPGFLDRLRIQVKSGMFSCQYWTFYKLPGGKADLTWTTKRQELTLDNKVHRKGDVIKGRIDFECVEQATNPEYVAKWPTRHPLTIKVWGVFKTVVE
ncbi:MAG: hypothetical protein AB1473_21255 [Thermodesulfobacteriota bacterium]